MINQNHEQRLHFEELAIHTGVCPRDVFEASLEEITAQSVLKMASYVHITALVACHGCDPVLSHSAGNPPITQSGIFVDDPRRDTHTMEGDQNVLFEGLYYIVYI
jgi:hypothetical protein